MDTFNFCPESLVPITLPPDAASAMSLNGWQFTSRPTVPYQKSFQLSLYGLQWILDPVTGLYDSATDVTHNARALELFYEQHGIWAPFYWTHPHIGQLTVRFKSAVSVPEGDQNSGGLIGKPVTVNLIHHNPGF